MAKLPELLAPVGDWTNLGAALDAGANAVYFGVKGFNMRASARNFGARDLPKLVERCHARGVKAYLALNVLVLEPELPRMERLLTAAKAAGVDAVIAFDLSVLEVARRLGLEVHASTQMSVANSGALRVLFALGVRRFVLARECSLTDVRRLRATLRKSLGAAAGEVQLELFAHGAMCVSISGRCFLSEHESGKSANQGACTQPCRREYRLVAERGGQEWRVGEGYLLSPKDLCVMPFLEKLLEAGVDSLKIEGRMRSPEYVHTVVSAYRRALDFLGRRRGRAGWREEWEAFRKPLLAELESVYNRGFSSGFYQGKPVGEWATTAGNVSTKRKYHVARVLNYYRKPAVAELAVTGEGFAAGDELLVEGPTTGFFTQKAESLRRDSELLDKALPGTTLTLPMSRQVRPGDKLYILK